jgi:hypothetical protein
MQDKKIEKDVYEFLNNHLYIKKEKNHLCRPPMRNSGQIISSMERAQTTAYQNSNNKIQNIRN